MLQVDVVHAMVMPTSTRYTKRKPDGSVKVVPTKAPPSCFIITYTHSSLSFLFLLTGVRRFVRRFSLLRDGIRRRSKFVVFRARIDDDAQRHSLLLSSLKTTPIGTVFVFVGVTGCGHIALTSMYGDNPDYRALWRSSVLRRLCVLEWLRSLRRRP